MEPFFTKNNIKERNSDYNKVEIQNMLDFPTFSLQYEENNILKKLSSKKTSSNDIILLSDDEDDRFERPDNR